MTIFTIDTRTKEAKLFFEYIKTPNKETLKAIKESKSGKTKIVKNYKKFIEEL